MFAYVLHQPNKTSARRLFVLRRCDDAKLRMGGELPNCVPALALHGPEQCRLDRGSIEDQKGTTFSSIATLK
jgi:hypothetical protein